MSRVGQGKRCFPLPDVIFALLGDASDVLFLAVCCLWHGRWAAAHQSQGQPEA